MSTEQIDWLDHHGDSDLRWRTKAEILERSLDDVIIRIHGEILHEDSKRVIIATEKRLDVELAVPLYRAYTVIYKKLILRREVTPTE